MSTSANDNRNRLINKENKLVVTKGREEGRDEGQIMGMELTNYYV